MKHGVEGKLVVVRQEPAEPAEVSDEQLVIPLERVTPTPIPLVTPAPAPPARPSPIPLSRAVVTPPVSPPFAAVGVDARPATPFRPPRAHETEIFVHEGTRYTGEVLRRAREARGLTLQVMAERTKIPRPQVEAIEGDRYDRLPAPVYLRGFLLALAKELRLDGPKVARSYLDALAAVAAGAHPPPRSR